MIRNSVKTRGYHVGLRFAPSAALDKTHRQEFQIKLSEGFDWRRQDFAERAWVLASPQAEGDPRSHVKLSIQPDALHFEEFFPISTFEMFLDNLRLALEGVAAVFTPRVILGSGAMVRVTLAAPGGDARVFLGDRCLHLADRLTPLGRPVHAVGVKLLMPPVDSAGQATWQAETKIESLIEDVHQIFVEVDAKWIQPTAWSADAVVERVRQANAYATDQVVSFLEQFDVP